MTVVAVTVTATDNYHDTSAPTTFKVTVRDTTPPVGRIGGVTNGAVYTLHRGPTPTFTATDGGSGIAPGATVGTLTAPGSPTGAGCTRTRSPPPTGPLTRSFGSSPA